MNSPVQIFPIFDEKSKKNVFLPRIGVFFISVVFITETTKNYNNENNITDFDGRIRTELDAGIFAGHSCCQSRDAESFPNEPHQSARNKWNRIGQSNKYGII
jgi:hypothetical protein